MAATSTVQVRWKDGSIGNVSASKMAAVRRDPDFAGTVDGSGGGASFAPSATPTTPPQTFPPYSDAGGPLGAVDRAAAAAQRRMTPGEVTRAVVPSVVSGIAPELIPALKSLPWLLSALSRAGVSFGASAGTDAAIQAARGQMPDRSSLVRGALDAGGGLTGDLTNAAVGNVAEGQMANALSRGVKTEDQLQAELALARRGGVPSSTVEPGAASFAKQAIAKRTAVGEPINPLGAGQSGAAKLTGNIDAATAARTATYNSPGIANQRFTFFDATKDIGSLKRQLIQEGNSQAAAKVDDIVASMKPSYQDARGRLIKWSPADFENQKSIWQGAVDDIQSGKVASEDASLRKQVLNRLVNTANDRLRALTPPAAGARMGTIENLNRGIGEDMNLRTVLQQAARQQTMHPAGVPSPLEPRASLTTALNPLSDPRVSSRLALFLTHPALRGAVSVGERGMAMPAILDYLQQLQAPQQTPASATAGSGN